MEKKYQSAVIPDPRTEEEKAKDHRHIAGVTFNQWVEKPRSSWKRYKQRIQDGSFSCCFQSAAKAIEVLTGKQISALVYFLRKNYPAQGAYLQDVGDIMKNKLTGLEADYPSQNQNEATMNKVRSYSALMGITGYRKPNIKDIDAIADTILTYGQCLLTFESSGDEWDEPNCTPRYKGLPIEFGHCICAVDYTLINGKKVLICEDSAGQWSSTDGLRLITEDFLKHRNTGAMTFIGAVDKTVSEVVFHQEHPELSPEVTHEVYTERRSLFRRIYEWFTGVNYTGK